MKEEKGYIIFTVRLDPVVKRQMKIQAIKKNLSMQDYVESLLKRDLEETEKEEN